MNKKDIFVGLFIALLLAGAISWFASSSPDGLERVAADKGFLEKGERQPVMAAPVPDYAWPGIKNEKLATSAAGVTGTLLVFGAAYGFAVLLKKERERVKHAFLDEYSRLDSLLHRRDPRVKIGAFFACILFVVLTPAVQMRAFFLYSLMLLALVFASGIPPRFVLKRSLEMMPIVLCIAAFVPFAKSGVVMFTLSAGPIRLPVTHAGLLLMWNVLIKAYLSIVCSILLINTTDFADLLKGFERLRVPGLLVMIVSFMYRYLFVIEDELERIQTARKSRSFRQHGWLQIRTLANIVGVLFIRSYEKAEVVYTAMCCRGYAGRVRTLHTWSLSKNDIYFLAMIIVLLITIRFSGG